MSFATITSQSAPGLCLLLATTLLAAACDLPNSAQYLDKGANKEPSSAASSQVPGLTSYDRVLETRPLEDNIGLECESWSTPFLPRFPGHILLEGAQSKNLYLRKDWLSWYAIPVLLGSLREAQPTCAITQDETSGHRQIQCHYFGGLLRRKRVLTIPLVASKVGTFLSNDTKPDHEFWYVLGATLTGSNVYRNSDKVDLVCHPRDPVFGYKKMTLDEVKKVQPWDRAVDIWSGPQQTEGEEK